MVNQNVVFQNLGNAAPSSWVKILVLREGISCRFTACRRIRNTAKLLIIL